MPKREDEFFASCKEQADLVRCYKHDRWFRRDAGGCQRCLDEAIVLRHELHAAPKANLKLEECPNCHQVSRFWNPVTHLYDCANGDCPEET